ncbi:TPA: MATE family efflux transporter [Streptococcus suis]|nr:MATE family efflux transporter [Streptococcus suis]HEM2664898.1 MATE family efflux transporter [Streptococcus suis]HEM2671045.1 MATE family efflux transporter [Streptococcus suis]HEM2744800.1 MATE family efflux transporter [Streptococcus suis]HEM5216727.1 MATE family efflux transporter [Streptococcus suis]
MNDLTKGKPIAVILQFAIPLLIGSFFQLAYNFADSMIVGHTLGKDAFASVGSTASLIFLIIGFAQGVTNGLTIISAQRFGAGDLEGLKKSFVHGLFYASLISLLLTVSALAFLKPILVLMQTPVSIIDHSHAFLTAMFGGLTFTIFYNFLSSALRSLGNSKTPLLALVIACFINIGLDFFFILVMNWGVFGAGFATIFAQACSVLFLIFYIIHKVPHYHIGLADLKLDRGNLKKHAQLAFPMGFQASIIAIGAMTLQFMVNQLGTDAIAAQAIALRTDQLAMLPMVNLGLAIATFTAQNYGAKLYDRIREGVRHSLLLSIAWAIVFAVILILGNRFFSGLFLPNASQTVLDLALVYYIINGSCYWIVASLFILRSFIQGLGKGFIPTLAGFGELIFRAAVAIIGMQYFGFYGTAAANPAAWIGSIIVLIPSSIIFMKKLKAGQSI